MEPTDEPRRDPGMTPRAADDPEATVLRAHAIAPQGIPPGTLLVNTYRVERLLGGGGMGEVYLVRHAGLGTLHAIKVIRTAMAMNRQVMDLFYREARVLRGVRHDAIVSYEGFVRDDQGRDYLVMEYAEGPSLADCLRRGPLSPGEVLALRDRLAAGLAEAHRQGAVHRDISPDNVILPGNRIEAAKLIDFGVCKLTDPTQETIIGSSFAGKHRYASPEQFGLFAGSVDARSDIYSLGLILAAAVQGRPLGMGETIEATLRSRQTVPDLSGVPASLRGWLSAMLQPDPARRPASMDVLLARWPARWDDGAPRTTGSVHERGQQRSDQGRAHALAWVIGLGLLAGAAGGLYWLLRPLPMVEQKQTTEPQRQSAPTAQAEEPGPLAVEPGSELAGATPAPQPALAPEQAPENAQPPDPGLTPQSAGARSVNGGISIGRPDQSLALPAPEQLPLMESEPVVSTPSAAQAEPLDKAAVRPEQPEVLPVAQPALAPESTAESEQPSPVPVLPANSEPVDSEAKRQTPPAPPVTKPRPAIRSTPSEPPVSAKPRPAVKKPPEAARPAPEPDRQPRRSGGSKPARCGDVLLKAQLGEPLSDSDRVFLQKECK